MVTGPHVPGTGGLGVADGIGGLVPPPGVVRYPSPVHDPSVILISSSIM